VATGGGDRKWRLEVARRKTKKTLVIIHQYLVDEASSRDKSIMLIYLPYFLSRVLTLVANIENN
jgi:hypothetical protein